LPSTEGTIEVELRLLTVMRGVETRRFVLFVVHPDHHAEEALHGIS
jgi:hypothetical protein